MKTILLSFLLLATAPFTFGQITGSGTLYNIARFTGTTQINNSQLYDNGINVGINTTTATFKLQVNHGGSNGIMSRSTAGYSVMDVDAANGESCIRFARAGAYQWVLGNNPLTNAFQVVRYGGAIRMFIHDANGNVGIGTIVPTAKLHVVGDLTCTGVKAFTIDHPLDPANKMLRHFAIESNEVLNSYSGNVVTNEKGVATVTLPDYFEAINKDFRYQLTVVGSFAQAIISREIANNSFEIATSKPGVKVSWEVKAQRNDTHMKQKQALPVEEVKPAAMQGKYFEPELYGQPASKGLNYQAPAAGAAATQTQPAAVTPDITGLPATGSQTGTAPAVKGGR